MRQLVHELPRRRQCHGRDVRRNLMRPDLRERLSPVRRRLREQHEHGQLQHVLHAMHATDGRECDVRRHVLRRRVPDQSEAVRGHLHPQRDGVQRHVPDRHARLQRELLQQRQRQFVRHLVHALSRSGKRDERGMHGQRHVRFRLQPELQKVRLHVHSVVRVLYDRRLQPAGQRHRNLQHDDEHVRRHVQLELRELQRRMQVDHRRELVRAFLHGVLAAGKRDCDLRRHEL